MACLLAARAGIRSEISCRRTLIVEGIGPGHLLGHYRLLEKIGEGGMGAVYAAEDTKLHRKVALKVLPPTLAESPERRSRFEREARAVAALNHPNIVTIHSVEESSGLHFITMELVEGEPLSRSIPPDGFSLDRFFDLAVPMVDALGAAHDRGITHRDLKPDNVMVGADGRVRMLDFGLAKLVQEPSKDETRTVFPNSTMTGEGKVVGTVPYMSPEQAQGKPVDHRTDIFSVGSLLYEMTTGQRPFVGDNPMSVLSSIIKDTPSEVSDLNRALPRHLGRIIRRCLDKDPERRYQRARDLGNELEDLRKEVTRDEIRAQTTSTEIPAVRPSGKPTARIAVAAIVVLIVAAGGFYWLRKAGDDAGTPGTAAPAVEPAATSVAVVPFVSMSADEDNEVFSDGMTEELINALAGIEGLRVPARSSVFAFKGKDMPGTEIGKTLGVDHVLEGSVRKAGDQLRVNAQLVSVEDGFQLWSDTYDREMKDIFVIQEEIATAIVGNLQTKLGGARPDVTVISRGTDDLEAHNLFLRARFLWSGSRNKEDLRKSVELYEQAIERDPGFARAWAGLADTHQLLASNYLPPREAMPMARAAAERALELDDELAAAHAVLGDILLFYDWDWPGSLLEYQRAIELEPESPRAHIGYGTVLTARGRFEEGLAQARLAEQLVPFALVEKYNIGLIYWGAGEQEEAVRIGRDLVGLAEDFPLGHALLGIALAQLGELDEAVEAARKASRLAGDPIIDAFLVHTLALSGDEDGAREGLAELIRESEERYICPYEIAMGFVGLEEHDDAIEWFEKGYEARADC
jgi:serine/threonine-protein kinase